MFDKLTLFYSLNTGKIKAYCTGEQSMDYFGEDKHDFNYGFIIVNYDDFIIRSLDNFTIINGSLVFKNDKYIMKRNI